MSEPEPATEALASTAKIHRGAAIVGTEPFTIRTPGTPWSYAVSFPLDTSAEGDFVVEPVVRVVDGSVGISCADERRTSLIGEVSVSQSNAPARLELLADPEHAAFLLVRTWSEPRPAVVEVHLLRLRGFSAEERAAVSAIATLQPVPRWSRYYGTAGESLVERVRVRDYLRLSAPARRPWIEGLSVIIHPADQLSRALYVSGLYEPNTALVLKRLLTTGATFLDVGAHAGVFTMLGSRYVGGSGRVFSFEPSARERVRLEQHVSANALENVTIVPSAVGGHEGRATLRVATAEYGGLNTLGNAFAYQGVESVGNFEVDVTTLDGCIEREGIARIDVVKLDIEGAECAALRGAARMLGELRPALIIEVVASALQTNGATARELQELLTVGGYAIYRIDDESAALRRVPDLDAVDEQNIVALPEEKRA